MATKKKPAAKKIHESDSHQIHFSVEPGTKVQITLDVGEKSLQGKIPVTVSIDQVAQEQHQIKEIVQSQPELVRAPSLPGRLMTGLEALKTRLKVYDLATWLFIIAVAIYLVTRLIGLKQFPIYFFTDEAIQSQSMVDLIKNGYRDSTGTWLPTYFRNGEYYNLSLRVYLQWLPALFFGKSAV